MPIRQITIIGTGLIGGSFGMAVKAKGFRGTIVGCDRKDVLTKAKRKGAIDVGITDPLKAIAGADIVLLAVPVGGILGLIATLAPHLPPHTLLTDVGSTKSEVLRAARKAFGEAAPRRFLGGHPMAGKENSGIGYADAELFQGAVWFLAPAPEEKRRAKPISEFLRLIKKIGARIAVLDPSEHDELCGWISHVPQMISTALASTLVEEYGENAPLLESGGRALREMTRFAARSYEMLRDIAMTNRPVISEALLKLEQKLAHIRENLGTRQLEREFEQAHRLKQLERS
jgi:prephenate dehydrogenase